MNLHHHSHVVFTEESNRLLRFTGAKSPSAEVTGDSSAKSPERKPRAWKACLAGRTVREPVDALRCMGGFRLKRGNVLDPCDRFSGGKLLDLLI